MRLFVSVSTFLKLTYCSFFHLSVVGSGISLCRAGPSVSGFTLAHAAFVMEATHTFVIVRRSNGDGAYTNSRMKREVIGSRGE